MNDLKLDTKKHRKNIILADCESDEIKELAIGLQEGDEIFEIKSHVANWKRMGICSELKRYIKYFVIGFYYFVIRNEFDIIVGWQQFYALIYCFFCELFHVHKKNKVIVLNFTYKTKKGICSKIYRWFMGRCVSIKYLDYLHVLSKEYADIISLEFGFPKNRIVVTPFGISDPYEKISKCSPPKGYKKEAYALSIGRSNRDFDFLIRAWKDIDYPLVIISDTYKQKVSLRNVIILNNINGDESYPWIMNCALMVIPIDDGSICSGDTVLLTAMASERKILVTIPSTLAEMYIKDGDNAVLIEKDQNLFRKKVAELLFSDKYKGIGTNARKYFCKNYSRENMGIQIKNRINEMS